MILKSVVVNVKRQELALASPVAKTYIDIEKRHLNEVPFFIPLMRLPPNLWFVGQPIGSEMGKQACPLHSPYRVVELSVLI